MPPLFRRRNSLRSCNAPALCHVESFGSSEPFACIRVLADGRAGPDAKAPSRTSSTEAYVNILERLIEHFVEAKPLLAVGERIGRALAALGMKHDDRHDRSPGRGMHGSFAGNP